MDNDIELGNNQPIECFDLQTFRATFIKFYFLYLRTQFFRGQLFSEAPRKHIDLSLGTRPSVNRVAWLTLGNLHHPAGHSLFRVREALWLDWFVLFANMYNAAHILLQITLKLVKYKKNEKSQTELIYLKLIVASAQHNPFGIK